jgi:hypothetical protein
MLANVPVCVVLEVWRIKIFVIEVVRLPQAVKAQPIRAGWHKGVPGQLMMPKLVRPEMPFPDICRPVIIASEYMADAFVFRTEAKLVDNHSRA